VRHDLFESTWKAQLAALVNHIANTKQHAAKLKYESDLLLITALRKPELEEVLALGWEFDPILTPVPGRQFVRKGSIRFGEQEISVHAGTTSKMGMVWTSLFVANAVHKLRPRLVAMTGICMGHPTEIGLGDIVVALHSWNWQAGRLSAREDGSAFFEPQPEPVIASRALTNLWDELAADTAVSKLIFDSFRGVKPDKPPKIKVAPMVSGSVVIAHESVHNDIFNQDRKIRAVDMETFGVFAGCDAVEALPPLFLSIKAVSDLGLPDKDDRFQQYCAYASAKALEIFLERFWVSNISPLFKK
jgi:nucleoside phosphorylase